MELRHYGTVLLRRLWIIVLVVGIVLLYVAYQYFILFKTPGALKAYQSNVSFQIGLQATTHSTDQFYTDYQSTSEALADELITGPLLTSPEFTTQVFQQIQADSDQITQRFGANADLGNLRSPAEISSVLSASRTHALVTISVNWRTAAGAWAIANAIGEVCSTHISHYLDYEVRTNPATSQSTQPQVGARVISAASEPGQIAGPGEHKITLLLMLLLVALILSIALAFLVEYLDDRIFSQDEAMQLLQLPIYGEIPASHKESKRRYPTTV